MEENYERRLFMQVPELLEDNHSPNPFNIKSLVTMLSLKSLSNYTSPIHASKCYEALCAEFAPTSIHPPTKDDFSRALCTLEDRGVKITTNPTSRKFPDEEDLTQVASKIQEIFGSDVGWILETARDLAKILKSAGFFIIL